MITVKLQGGMGNQLFQYAYGANLADRGYHVQFDDQSLRAAGTPRPYSLGFLNAPLGIGTGRVVPEDGMRFNPEFLKPDDPSVLYGYWQTEKYFPKDHEKFRRVVLDGLFPVRTTLASEAYAINWRKIYRAVAIAVHVRRQDYVRLQSYHGMPTLDYYREAIKHIRALHYGATPFVFSDDPQWCHENFPQDIHIVEGTNQYEDMRLMSACKHAVIANSSFSWWGSWLGDNQLGRTVVAPKRWFARDDIDASDVVPERWTKL